MSDTAPNDDRRAFLKRMAAVGVAVPVVTTLGAGGVQRVFAQTPSTSVVATTTTVDGASGLPTPTTTPAPTTTTTEVTTTPAPTTTVPPTTTLPLTTTFPLVTTPQIPT